MCKKKYISPKVKNDITPTKMAAPLAFFSAATAAAAVGGAVVGAVAASKVLGDDLNRRKLTSNSVIVGLII